MVKIIDSVLILLNEYRVQNGINSLDLMKAYVMWRVQAQYCADILMVTHKQTMNH